MPLSSEFILILPASAETSASNAFDALEAGVAELMGGALLGGAGEWLASGLGT